MKVLVITGKLAAEEVKKAVKDFEGVDVFVADVEVAAFLTPDHIRAIDLSRYDLVLLPGNAKGNWEELEKETGVRIRLGSIHAADLPAVLRNLERVELSHSIPACRLLMSAMAEEIIELVESDRSRVEYAVEVGETVIGEGRIKVVAEIVDAPEMSEEELVERVDYYSRVADVIDVGIPVGCDADRALKAVKTVLDHFDSVSVDTFDRRVIEKSVKAGVHMVMSVGNENLKALDVIENQAVVVVSRNVGDLLELVELARKKGKNVIADCILDAPLSLFSSLERYAEYRKRDEKTPLLFGAGNVTELCDADSVGINAILAFLAEEIGANALFTTEASNKTKGSLMEARVATYMARAAKLRKSFPKDFGFSLLALKEKASRGGELKYNREGVIEAEPGGFVRDPRGDFRIGVEGRKVVAVHDSGVAIRGDAESVSKTAIRMGLVSRLDHAAYLGRELQKAEIAARLGKSYVQDEELDFGIFTRAAHPALKAESRKMGSKKMGSDGFGNSR